MPIDAAGNSRILFRKKRAELRTDLQTAFMLCMALVAMAELAARLAPPTRSDDLAHVASGSAGQGTCL